MKDLSGRSSVRRRNRETTGRHRQGELALIDIFTLRRHHRNVLTIARTVAAALIAVLSSGPVAVCAGWQATPEARMACCVEGVACPMHVSESAHSDGKQAITQAEADDCCAASEGDTGSSAKTTIVISPALQQQTVLLPPAASARLLVPSDPVSDRAGAVPRHLLNSVFLV